MDALLRRLTGAIAIALVLACPRATSAQIGVVINGRVEDAATRTPVAGALVFTSDSLPPVATDSLGVFAVLIPRDQPLSVRVESFGYRFQQFDFEASSADQISVLLLEPEPIELEGITIVEEPALERVFRQLARRRNAYPRSVMAYDRARLQRFAPVGTALDFLRSRVPGMFECAAGWSGLCVWGRGSTPRNTFPEDPVTVCVDGWESLGATGELGNIDIRDVALVEILDRGRGGVRVYTAPYLLVAARDGRRVDNPFPSGC